MRSYCLYVCGMPGSVPQVHVLHTSGIASSRQQTGVVSLQDAANACQSAACARSGCYGADNRLSGVLAIWARYETVLSCSCLPAQIHQRGQFAAVSSQALAPKHMSMKGSLRASGCRQLGHAQVRAEDEVFQQFELWQEEQHLCKPSWRSWAFPAQQSICPVLHDLDACSFAQKEMINTLLAVLLTGGLACACRVHSAYVLLIIVQDVLVLERCRCHGCCLWPKFVVEGQAPSPSAEDQPQSLLEKCIQLSSDSRKPLVFSVSAQR